MSDNVKPNSYLRRIEVKVGIAAAFVICVFAALFGTHVICAHSWLPASCTAPSACEICGRQIGEPLGHKWIAPTCDKPQSCSVCGELGPMKALGHDWKEATCEEPKRCTRCGATEGEALGHSLTEWSTTKQASCTEEGRKAATCTRCGKVVEEALPRLDHTPGDWVVTREASVSSKGRVTPGTREQKCTVCGKTLKEETFTIDLTVSQKNALGSAASYLNFSAFSYTGLIHQLEFEGFSTEDATFAADHCGADWMVQAEKSAESYLRFMSFSRSGLIDQLEFEGFTPEQAEHGADYVGL